MWCHRHGEVKAVYQTNAVRRVIVLAMVEAELSQSSWGDATSAVALQATTTVAGCTGEVVVVVSATSTGPDPARPVAVGYRDGDVRECVEDEATAVENRVAGVGLNGWPDSEFAVVNQG